MDDKQKYLEFRNLSTPIIEKIQNIIDEYPDLYKLPKSSNLSEIIRETNKELELLKKYASCIHEPSEEFYHGHDSHYDYYKIECMYCKKILNSRKH